ncbi:MAG: Ppx/GppA family phosphatase, partial [Halioglobus sp.]|nr:Ppx/GppA family phosphatase [Halioglobus sp.]
DTPEVIAAVDLGSNSFHMIVGELRHGQLTIIDRLRETVRLSEGLEITGTLSEAAKQRALECLSRFGERLRNMRASNVRAAGTSTMRRARDARTFGGDAERALGHPIEIISGAEEARLIYDGVLHSMPRYPGHRLVLDIGGGSTELILGHGESTKALESLHLGCVAMTERYFSNGEITPDAFTRARVAARLELLPVKAFFREAPDLQAIGSSGTILATNTVARDIGLVDGTGLTLQAVESLIERIIDLGTVGNLKLPGLSERRAQVWPGGLAILVEVLQVLSIPRMQVSDGALREGLLYEMLGRLRHEDARERTVRAMASRYHVDERQADRVSACAHAFHQQCAGNWDLTSDLAYSMLSWAARLHEIGLDISHDGYQRHGAYIAANADMPGFPWSEQALLAFLIANQRRQLRVSSSRRLPLAWRRKGLRLSILLRLAVLINRSRSSVPLPEIRLRGSGRSVSLAFPEVWLTENPLTLADLQREQEYLQRAGFTLTVDTVRA